MYDGSSPRNLKYVINKPGAPHECESRVHAVHKRKYLVVAEEVSSDRAEYLRQEFSNNLLAALDHDILYHTRGNNIKMPGFDEDVHG